MVHILSLSSPVSMMVGTNQTKPFLTESIQVSGSFLKHALNSHLINYSSQYMRCNLLFILFLETLPNDIILNCSLRRELNWGGGGARVT